ncbi:MAG TPA: lipid A deacylase LpxR family protein [Stellaceae bacterium]|nr:lipid A deacylase LpxR family protein [Stellaceae bacterium]
MMAVSLAARADDGSRINILEENDSLYFTSDRHYTQGLRISYLGPDVGGESGWNMPFDALHDLLPIFTPKGDVSRRYALEIGQSIFTPENLKLNPPDPRDRPYGAWTYAGLSFLEETGRRTLENVELQAGVVGPAALGEVTQNDFHEFIKVHRAMGWHDQIQNEPGILISYERKRRLLLLGDDGLGLDIVPEIDATVGNVFTYGEIGTMLRFGKNIGADYGPVRVRPAQSGSDYFNADHLDGDFGFYGFIGVAGRAVGRNIFLDGNTFRTSRNVDKEILVGDLQGGIALFWSSAFRLDFTVGTRSPEFVGQRHPDLLGSAALSFSW